MSERAPLELNPTDIGNQSLEAKPELASSNDLNQFNTPERAEAAAEVRQKLITGLSDLYEILQHQGEVKAEDVEKLIKHTRLDQELPLPFWRKALSKAIAGEKLNQKPKDKFLSEAITVLELWIGLESGNRELTRQLDEHEATARAKVQSTDAAELQRIRDHIEGLDSEL